MFVLNECFNNLDCFTFYILLLIIADDIITLVYYALGQNKSCYIYIAYDRYKQPIRYKHVFAFHCFL